MVRFYTGLGDDGTTDLLGARVAKDDPRIDALGSLDEATSVIGLGPRQTLWQRVLICHASLSCPVNRNPARCLT